MLNIGTLIDDRYEILKEIDRGGMSIIYLAADNRLNKSVVLKDIRKDNKINNEVLLECLKAEADLLTLLDHPNLPKIYDIIEGIDHIYVVMDYIEGESLKKKLDREKRFKDTEVINWAIQLADVLDYLHTRKPKPIIYRDMKPHNIMLTPEGKIKLIDFGISITEDNSNVKNFGTSTYAAPEQVLSKRADQRTDIYSLGVTLYQLLSGEKFKDNRNLPPLRSINSSISEGTDYIIGKCIKEDPNLRYQSSRDLLSDLKNINKFTQGYRKSLVKKISLFLISFILFIVSSTVTFIGYKGMKGSQLDQYKKYINEARTFIAVGENVKAIEILDKAITEVDSSASEAYITILDLYINMDDANTGISKIEGYINDKYGNVNKNNEVLFKLAITYLDNKNYPLALKYFNQINKGKIPDIKYYIPITESMSNMNTNYGELKEQLISFENYVDSLPNNERKLENYNSLSNIYSSYKGQIENANDKTIEIVDKADMTLSNIDNQELNLKYEVQFRQKLAQAYHSKGSNLGDKQEAEKYFNTAIEFYNDLIDLEVTNRQDILIKIGDIYSEKKEYPSAIEQFKTVISKYPNSVRAYSKLINVLLDIEQERGESTKDYSQAKHYYNIALSIEDVENNEDFKRVKRRMINLEII
ncbi:protein kinase [Clostridium tertium]|uniref:non-specific serine/threonine protein kinase n=1 Tax=Clostridium tertium TaxID=1559 RepID=A0A6N3A3K4_9CLOT